MELSFLMVFGSVIGAFGLVSALLAVAHKRHYLVHTALALYITTAVIAVMPRAWIHDASFALAVVCGVFVVVLLMGPSLFWAVDEWQDYRVPWRFMVFGVATLGMATSIVMPFVTAAGIVVPFVTADVMALFTDGVYAFVWMVAPAVSAVVVRRV